MPLNLKTGFRFFFFATFISLPPSLSFTPDVRSRPHTPTSTYLEVVRGVRVLIAGDDLRGHPVRCPDERVPSPHRPVQLGAHTKVHCGNTDGPEGDADQALRHTLQLWVQLLTQLNLCVFRQQHVLPLYVSVDDFVLVEVS